MASAPDWTVPDWTARDWTVADETDLPACAALDAAKWLMLRAPPPPAPDQAARPPGAQAILARRRLVDSWLSRPPRAAR